MADLLQLLLVPEFLVSLAVRSVIAGIILFLTSRLVGAKGGLLASMGVAFLSTVIVIFLFEVYVFPLLEVETANILGAIKNNLFGLVLTYLLPGVVWFFLVIMLLRVGPVQALIIAFVQWLLGLALTYLGVLTFLTEYL